MCRSYLLAITTACRRWPEAHITLRRGKCIIEDSRQKPALTAPSFLSRYPNNNRTASTAITSSATATMASPTGRGTTSRNFRPVGIRIH